MFKCIKETPNAFLVYESLILNILNLHFEKKIKYYKLHEIALAFPDSILLKKFYKPNLN